MLGWALSYSYHVIPIRSQLSALSTHHASFMGIMRIVLAIISRFCTKWIAGWEHAILSICELGGLSRHWGRSSRTSEAPLAIFWGWRVTEWWYWSWFVFIRFRCFLLLCNVSHVFVVSACFRRFSRCGSTPPLMTFWGRRNSREMCSPAANNLRMQDLP